jgi:hypothetical protein
MGRIFSARGLGREAASLLAAVVLGVCAGQGCRSQRPERPPNPILEDRQAKLAEIEGRLRAHVAPAHADYLELGIARYLVWNTYLERSRYPAVQSEDRRQAEENRQQAAHLEPQVIDAFVRAMDHPPDPLTAAGAKVWLARVYSEVPDLRNEVLLLRRILADHRDLHAPAIFGSFGTPQFYCYTTLAGVYQSQEERPSAIDALARALLAVRACQEGGGDVGDAVMPALGRLIEYEPRLVLPQYQRLLPTGIDAPGGNPASQAALAPALAEIFRTHRERASTRIIVTVDHQDPAGLLVRWRVVFPAYRGIIAAWEKDMLNPHPQLGDDFSHLKPTFRLRFATLPASEDFSLSKQAAAALGPTRHTPPLVFDENGRSEGRMILPWANGSGVGRPQNLYLVAQIVGDVNGLAGVAPAVPAHEVYMEPVAVRLDWPR